VDGPIRLDLGGGTKHYPGWINVDCADQRNALEAPGKVSHAAIPVNADVSADLFDLPFPDDYADEARAIHVIEHLWPWDAERALREWIRVLKPGAPLAIECPCLEKVLQLAQVPQCPPQYTYWALYGDPRYKDPLMMHRWCYGQAQLMKLMAQAGLVNLRQDAVQFHEPVRDMRIVGQKPMPESVIQVAQ